MRGSRIVQLSLFQGLRRPFHSTAPMSDVTCPGPFWRHEGTLPGTMKRATKREKRLLQEIGKELGCHTCGDRTTKYNADHQPSNKEVNEEMRKEPVRDV